MCDTMIEVAVMVAKKEDLGVELAGYTGPTEETY